MLPALPFQLSERYDVIEEIGQGGHAVVYRAYDRSLSRDVAVKMLREDVSFPDIRARFAQEVQLLATLQHAHILHVHDSGSYDNRPFVVMELAPAQTLAHRLEREPQLPIQDAVEITRDVASALAHAHSRAVLHRDVKPANILLGPGGAILADFGIARVTGEMAISRITGTGEAVGTLQYMSPEQLCAEQVDGRSDQYSLACVLYEMLAGVRPHTAATFEGLRVLRLTARHAPVSVYRPTVTPVLEEVLARAMAVAPADRYRSMNEFLMALDLTRTGDTPIASASLARVTGGSNAVPTAVAPPTRTARWQLPAIVAVLVLGSAALGYGTRAPRAAEAAESPGALAVSLLPASDALTDSVRDRVARELSAWSGVRVVSPDKASRRLTVGATALSDSVQLRLESRSDSGGITVSRMLARSALATADATIAALTREALAGRAASEVPGLDGIPERSLTALHAYVRGHALLRSGQLDSAAQAFRDARDTLPKFAQARFWAAQSTAWSTPRAVDRWKSDADEAVRLGTMRGVDSLLAVGLQRMAVMDFPGACAAYRGAIRTDAESLFAWLGLAECQRMDDAVSRAGERSVFRSSHWNAVAAYTRAVALAPSDHVLAFWSPRINEVLYVSGSALRFGERRGALPTFAAYPALNGDSLAFYPALLSIITSGDPRAVPATWLQALRLGRRTAIELHRRMLQRFPASSTLKYRLALALETAGKVDTADAEGAQRMIASIDMNTLTARERALIDLTNVRLALRQGRIDVAIQQARATLNGGTALTESSRAALASLTGDRNAIRNSRYPVASMELPSILRDSLLSLQQASLSGDCESVRSAYRGVTRSMMTALEANRRTEFQQQTLRALARSSVPCLGAHVFNDFDPSVPFDFALQDFAKGNNTAAQERLRRLASARSGATQSTITWDFQYLESWLLAQSGDTASAVERLVSAFDDLAAMSQSTVEIPEQAAALRLSLALLRDLGRGATPTVLRRETADRLRLVWLPMAERVINR